jgi:repressor LexA
MGRVTAGLPVLAVEDIEGYVPVTENLKRGRELFALRIDGESMINAGILDGDIVIVHRTPVANNGDIVIALIEMRQLAKDFIRKTVTTDFNLKMNFLNRLLLMRLYCWVQLSA